MFALKDSPNAWAPEGFFREERNEVYVARHRMTDLLVASGREGPQLSRSRFINSWFKAWRAALRRSRGSEESFHLRPPVPLVS
jgi:hypothetical protein